MTDRALIIGREASHPRIDDVGREYEWLWKKCHPKRGAAPAEALIEAAALRRAADELLMRVVTDYRRAGWSWAQIAECVSMTKQGVQQAHARWDARQED